MKKGIMKLLKKSIFREIFHIFIKIYKRYSNVLPLDIYIVRTSYIVS